MHLELFGTDKLAEEPDRSVRDVDLDTLALAKVLGLPGFVALSAEVFEE